MGHPVRVGEAADLVPPSRSLEDVLGALAVPTSERFLPAHSEDALVEPVEQAGVAGFLHVPEPVGHGEQRIPPTTRVPCLGARHRPGDYETEEDGCDDDPDDHVGIHGTKVTVAGATDLESAHRRSDSVRTCHDVVPSGAGR